MTAFRILAAVLLAACTAPAVVLAAAWGIAAVSGCELRLERAHACRLAAADIGWLLDALVRIGVWGALTLGLGAYVFAAWITVELAAIVGAGLRRG